MLIDLPAWGGGWYDVYLLWHISRYTFAANFSAHIKSNEEHKNTSKKFSSNKIAKMVVWSSASRAIAQPGLLNILSKPGALQTFYKHGKRFSVIRKKSYAIQIVNKLTRWNELCNQIHLHLVIIWHSYLFGRWADRKWYFLIMW